MNTLKNFPPVKRMKVTILPCNNFLISNGLFEYEVKKLDEETVRLVTRHYQEAKEHNELIHSI